MILSAAEKIILLVFMTVVLALMVVF